MHVEDYVLVLNMGDRLNLTSNMYPNSYPIYEFYTTCYRRFSINEGALKIRILDSRISIEDTIAIGMGVNPSVTSVVYATNAAAKMPVRGNHPDVIYVPSTIIGTHMWIVFGVAQQLDFLGLHQFSTINSGFLMEISAVDQPGKCGSYRRQRYEENEF